MPEPEALILNRPEKLQHAIDLLGSLQASPWNARPLIGATLDALDNGDVGTALFHIDNAQHYTLTGKREVTAAAALIRQAFDLSDGPF